VAALWAWPIHCAVPLSFRDQALVVASFACSTSPPAEPRPTYENGEFSFDCSVEASAAAACLVSLALDPFCDWSIPLPPSSHPQDFACAEGQQPPPSPVDVASWDCSIPWWVALVLDETAVVWASLPWVTSPPEDSQPQLWSSFGG
jgi:hypothetical protein